MLMSIGLRTDNIYILCWPGAMQILGTEFKPNMMRQLLQVSSQRLSRTFLMVLIVLSGAIRL